MPELVVGREVVCVTLRGLRQRVAPGQNGELHGKANFIQAVKLAIDRVAPSDHSDRERVRGLVCGSAQSFIQEGIRVLRGNDVDSGRCLAVRRCRAGNCRTRTASPTPATALKKCDQKAEGRSESQPFRLASRRLCPGSQQWPICPHCSCPHQFVALGSFSSRN